MGKNHPVWSLIRLTILMIALCVILYINATRFDETELRSILMMFLAVAGLEGFTHILAKKK